MFGGDLLGKGDWIVTCREHGQPHDLKIPMHPFSPAAGVTCERGHQYAWLEARKLVPDHQPLPRHPLGVLAHMERAT
jgi:hypothetical protein